MALIDKASLLMVPSVYEDGTLYNVLPSGNKAPDETGNHNGYDQTRADFTFSRGSNLTATRVNANGLIEKGRENLLFPSENTNTGWSASGTGTNTSSIQTGQQDPNGGTRGFRWTATCGSTINDRAFYRKNHTRDGSYLTLSFWVKSANGSNQTITFHYAGGQRSTINVTTEWQRVEYGEATVAGVGYFGAEIRGTISDTSADVYLYGWQLEKSLVATDYIETGATTATAGVLENTPRIDYSSGAGALLLEPQRTNLFTHSEYFNSWVLGGITPPTLTANYSQSPEGLQNAYRVQLPNIATDSLMGQIVSHTSGAAMTISAWVKSASGSNEVFKLYGDYGTPTGRSSQFTATSEWQRFTFTFTPTATGSRGTGLLSINNTASDLLVYAMQIETGSYATSYVPTYGSAATRGADFSSDDDLTANPIAFGANDDFTLFYEGSFDDLSSTSNMIMGGGRQQLGNSYKNYWWVQNATSMRITGDAEVRLATTSMSLTDNTNHKLLVKRSGSVVDFFVDGTKLTTTQNNPNTAFTFRSLGWAYTNSVYKVSGNMKKAIVFDSALTDAECISLTS